MKISSGAKISKSTLKNSVKAIKEQDVLINFSKDSADKGVYVSIAYAPGSGKDHISTNDVYVENEIQIINVTIHNIPRYNEFGSELFMIEQASMTPYYRMQRDGKIYASGDGALAKQNLSFSIHSIDSTFSPGALAVGPGSENYTILRPAITVDEQTGLPELSNPWTSPRFPHKTQFWHPEMSSASPTSAIQGLYPAMGSSYNIYRNAGANWEWVADKKYVKISFPVAIRQGFLPDNGVFGLTDLCFEAYYYKHIPKETTTWWKNSQMPNTYWNIDGGAYQLNELILLKSSGPNTNNLPADATVMIIGDISAGKRTNKNTKILSSINELQTYGIQRNNGQETLAVRPANSHYHPSATTNAFVSGSLLGRELYDSKPQLILSENGLLVEKSTLGRWFSKDKKHGKNIGFKCEWQRNYENLGWSTFVTQNEGFTRSNIKLEDLFPVIDYNGNELDQDYLKYFFQAYNNGFDIQGEDQINGAWNGIRAKITARLKHNDQVYESYMYSNEVAMPVAELAALSYYYYGGDGFEGIGVSNL